ncbi:MAG: hypothetical protein ACKO2P_14130 [Planctomycetota bacterium]
MPDGPLLPYTPCMVESTVSETLFWSSLRAVLVACCALWPLLMLQRVWERTPGSGWRIRTIAAAVLPFFIPELLTGFHYRIQATIWAAQLAPAWNAIFTEGLYAFLQLLRAVSAGAIVLLLLPGNPAAAARLHTWDLLRAALPAKVWLAGRLRLLLTEVFPAPLAAWSVMALIVFQEFETAALMQIDRHPLTWTVWMFDAHAAQQPLAESLSMVAGPLAVELLLLAPLALVAGSCCGSRPRTVSAFFAGEQRQAGRGLRVTATVYALIAILVLIGIPTLRLGTEAISGLRLLWGTPRLLQQSLTQVLTSTAVSAGVAMAALAVCGLLINELRTTSRTRLRAIAVCALALLPGLAGSLAISLTLLALFQTPWLRPLYDTWLPMVLGQLFGVLPRAFALQLLLGRHASGESVFSAEQLCRSPHGGVRGAAAGIVWRLVDVRWLGALLLLTQWCFWDVTSTSILRPLTPEPAVTRLYNEMHFARTEVLLGLTAVSALCPVLLWMGGLLLSRAVRKKRTRS